MKDCHIHLERGDYSEAWLYQFIDVALERGLSEIYLLEHSHRFVEFLPTFTSLKSHPTCGDYQSKWLEKKAVVKLEDYIAFIEKMKKKDLPIQVKFGLEVCYLPDQEQAIKALLDTYDWDFVTGSVHWIDGWGFDHPRTQDSWKQMDVDHIYTRYYDIMVQLIDSNMFDILAHPDSIKCFGYYPNIDLRPLYQRVIEAAKDNGRIAFEQSAGLYNRYDHKDLGMNSLLLEMVKTAQVPLVTTSDAHCPGDVGKNIKEILMTLA